MDQETEFFKGLIELQYGKRVEKKLEKISGGVPWAKGWPESDESFWNAEAFMWGHKIGSDRREFIKKELKFLLEAKWFNRNLSKNKLFHRKLSLGSNLDLGCGAYSYLPSVGLDFSVKMLQFNQNCKEKVIGNLEKKLPLEEDQFDSVTAVFVLNYIKNYGLLLAEVKRVLKPSGGIFIAVLSALEINPWQRQKEVNTFSGKEWKDILEKQGFKVKFYQKEKLWFFKCDLNG